jgi:hypothetical protein
MVKHSDDLNSPMDLFEISIFFELISLGDVKHKFTTPRPLEIATKVIEINDFKGYPHIIKSGECPKNVLPKLAGLTMGIEKY